MKNTDLRAIAEGYQEESRKAFKEKDLIRAVRLAQDAVQLFKICGDDMAYARGINFLGVVYSNMGDETMAVDYYLEGLEFSKKKGLNSVISLFYNNIGSKYQELGQHKKAIFYFEKAIEAQQHEDAIKHEKYWDNMFVYTLNMALSHQRMGDNEKAAYYLEEVDKIREKSQCRGFEISVLVSKCSIYWEQGKYEFVKEHLDELMELCQGQRVVRDYVQNVQEVAALLQKTQQYEYWKRLLEDVEETTNQYNMIYYRIISVEMWMEYYYACGEVDRYNELCVKYVQLCREQKEVENRERGQTLDIRIALRKKEEENRAAEAKAQTDALTRLGNRYALEKECKRLVQEAVRYDNRIAVGIIDIDCFKQVNDTYGHNIGDEYLCKVADVLKNAIDGHGKIYRFGGDEFVVLISEGDYGTVERIAKRIRRKIIEASIENKNSILSDLLTISQGYACFRPEEGECIASLLEHADAALYKAKDDGRDGYHIILEDLQ